MQEKCYRKTVGEEEEEATLLRTASKDYFNQFNENPFDQKCGSVFGKQKVEPVIKDETPEVAKPAAVESN